MNIDCYNKISNRRVGVLITIISILILFVVACARVNNATGDSYGSLWVSESIIDFGTIRLDGFGDLLNRFDYQVVEENGHYYHLFPIGTPILSVPIVAVVKFFGGSMVENELLTQKLISAFLAVGIFLMLYRIGRIFLPAFDSVGIAAMFWFGTSFSSVLGTALWSQNYPTFIALLVIYHVVNSYEKNTKSNSIYVGVLLFVAYLCRPAFSLLSPIVLLFILSFSWRKALLSGLVVAVLLFAFFLFWYFELGNYLPEYYRLGRLNSTSFWTGMVGTLFSPSRGLFIYSPFLLLPLLTLHLWFKEAVIYWRYYVFLLWSLLLLLVISSFPDWYGGHSYGSRYMNDVIPGIFVLYVIYVKVFFSNRHRILVGVLVVAAFLSIYIHVFQGMYNSKVALWNIFPDVNVDQSVLFDWEYPQFMHNSLRQEHKIQKYGLPGYPKFNPPFKFEYTERNVVWGNWKDDGNGCLRHNYGRAYVAFSVGENTKQTGRIRMNLDCIGPCVVKVALNDVCLDQLILNQSDSIVEVDYPVGVLLDNRVNVLSFELLEARKFPVNTKEILALYLYWIEFL